MRSISRLGCAAGCAALLLALVAMVATDRAAAAVPRKVWIGGDSLAYQIRPTLDTKLRAAGVASVPWLCKSSSGMVVSSFFNWPNTARTQMKKHRPRATVFMIGTNDHQPITANGRVYQYGSSGWKTIYRKRVAAVMKSMLSNGAQRVYWIGLPIMAPGSDLAKPVVLLNKIYRSEANKRPAVTYIDAWKLFSDSSGRYVAKWRASDGIHFNMQGVNRLVSVVVKKVRAGR